MSTFYHLGTHLKKHGIKRHKPLYIICIMLFFWTVFDGIVSYIAPLLISEHGFSNSQMGMIIGFSSVAGALLDIGLTKFVRKPNYRKVYLAVFLLSSLQFFTLWKASSLGLFLLAMALWGFYYDLLSFANFDFIGRRIEEDAHVSSFGVIDVFISLGYFVAPVILGASITGSVTAHEFLLGLVFLLCAFGVFGGVLTSLKKTPDLVTQKSFAERSTKEELGIWFTLMRHILPALIVIFFMNIYYAFFWTIGPLYSEGFTAFHPLNGSFLAVFGFPPLLVGWVVGPMSKKIKDKRFPIFLFLSAFFLLTFFVFNPSPYLVLVIIFLSSFMVSFMWSNIAAFFSRMIEHHPRYEKEIETIEDFFTNLGFIIGPAFAGILSDKIGFTSTFAFLGIVGSVIAFILLSGPYEKMLRGSKIMFGNGKL